MRAVYFAWVRERIGKAQEDIDLPPEVRTVAEVVAWMRGRGDNYAHAFENGAAIRAALDRRHAKPTTAIGGASEIAFFPPMTGG